MERSWPLDFDSADLAPETRTPARPAVPAWLGDWLLAWPLPLAVLALWALAAHFEWIAPQVLPSPEAVALTLKESLLSGELWANLQISLVRVFAGFAVGLVGGLALGVAMGLSPTVKEYVYPLFEHRAELASVITT